MTEDSITLNGLRLRYQVEGHGPDVLFIHGWASSRRMWAQLSAGLAATYRCWAIDLPGFGDSDKPANDWYSIANYTALVASFLRALGLSTARVVGHSMGGMVALDFAAAHPEQLTHLVVINPVVTGHRVRLRPFAHWGPSLRVLGLTHRLSLPVLQPVLAHSLSRGWPQSLKPIVRRFGEFSRTTAHAMWHSGRAIIQHDLTPRLARITAPALVLISTLDLMVANREGRLAAERIPGARLVVLHAGHMATDDRPAEVLQQLQEFLV